MPIYYALVAKDQPKTVVLCDYTSYSGNFQNVAMKLMERITPNSMKTFELDDYFFHYINEDGISVLCMTDKQYKRKSAFAFLQDTKKSLLNYYTQRDLMNAQDQALRTFSSTMREKMVSESAPP